MLAKSFISGVVLVLVQAWQEGEKHTAVYQLRATMVDLSNFLSYRIMAMSLGSLADHAIFQTCLEDVRNLVGLRFFGGDDKGPIDLTFPVGANRVTYQPCSPLTGRKWSKVNMEMIPRTSRGYSYTLTSGHSQPSCAVESRANGPG